MWQHFLDHWNGIFYEDALANTDATQLFTDAAPSLGFGGLLGKRWFSAAWPPEFASLRQSSILYELYPVVVAAIIWGEEWSRKTIAVRSDNSATVEIINKGRSRCLDIMLFMRKLT